MYSKSDWYRISEDDIKLKGEFLYNISLHKKRVGNKPFNFKITKAQCVKIYNKNKHIDLRYLMIKVEQINSVLNSKAKCKRQLAPLELCRNKLNSFRYKIDIQKDTYCTNCKRR